MRAAPRKDRLLDPVATVIAARGAKSAVVRPSTPFSTITVADAGIDADEVGLANALAVVTSASPKPPKSAGEKVEDEGDGGAKVAAFLVSQKLI